MTTIATDGHSMAADSLSTAGGERVAFPQKLHRASDGRLFGSAGPSADCALFTKWMRGETGKPDLSDGFSALVLTPEGRVFYLCPKLEPVEFIVPQAIGSGAPYAIGAMLAGASPEEAVRIAIQRDTTSGGEIQSLCLNETPVLREVA